MRLERAVRVKRCACASYSTTHPARLHLGGIRYRRLRAPDCWLAAKLDGTRFVLDSLERALYRRRRWFTVAEYVSIKYPERLAEPGIAPSIGSVGDSCENALPETIQGLYMAKVLQRRDPWRSFKAVEFTTLRWVDLSIRRVEVKRF